MPRKPLSVFVVSRWFVVMDCPHPLEDAEGDRCKGLPDYEENTLWLDPELPKEEREEVIAELISRAWAYLLRASPLID
jgi:hypothetical protein